MTSTINKIALAALALAVTMPVASAQTYYRAYAPYYGYVPAAGEIVARRGGRGSIGAGCHRGIVPGNAADCDRRPVRWRFGFQRTLISTSDETKRPGIATRPFL